MRPESTSPPTMPVPVPPAKTIPVVVLPPGGAPRIAGGTGAPGGRGVVESVARRRVTATRTERQSHNPYDEQTRSKPTCKHAGTEPEQSTLVKAGSSEDLGIPPPFDVAGFFQVGPMAKPPRRAPVVASRSMLRDANHGKAIARIVLTALLAGSCRAEAPPAAPPPVSPPSSGPASTTGATGSGSDVGGRRRGAPFGFDGRWGASPPAQRRGDVAPERFSLRTAGGTPRIHPHPCVSRARAPVGGSPGRRLLGELRLEHGARDDQPSLRQPLHRTAFDGTRDYVSKGFYAKTEKGEVPCPEIEVNQLVAITDVTARIDGAARGLTGARYNEANKAEQSKIEKECATGDDVRCDVVSLYHGGRYHLYKYRRYQDVRLVFAPEFSVAFFGGDPDNFMFPRYDLDVSFLRVYQDNKPLVSPDHFAWSPGGVKEGDLTFVAGHPWGTSRELTVAELEYLRDFALPTRLLRLAEARGLLTEFRHRGPKKSASPARSFSRSRTA